LKKRALDLFTKESQFGVVFLYLIVGLLLFTAGALTTFLIINPRLQNKEIRENGYQYISPLLDCQEDNSPIITSAEKDIIEKINNEVIDKLDVQASVYYRNLNNGPWFTINDDLHFSGASLNKIPLAIAYLKLSESIPNILEEEIILNSAECPNKPQLFEPQDKLISGQVYTIRYLLDKLLTQSNNDAECMLFKNIDYKYIRKVYDDLGLEEVQLEPRNNEISIYETIAPGVQLDINNTYYMQIKYYSSIFRMLYNSSFLNRENSEYILEILSNSTFNEGLTKQLPDDITVAHKFGSKGDVYNDGFYLNKYNQLHDCGIVYYPNNPYLLCIMTKGQTSSILSEAISNISKIIYTTISSEK